MTTSIVHCKKAKFDVYIGRPGPWGNPFEIGKPHPQDGRPMTRMDVIELFDIEFHNSTEWTYKWMRQNIWQLKGKTLGCWCSPQACHGDILKKYADQT